MKKYLFVCGIVMLSGCSGMGSMFSASGSSSSGASSTSGMSGMNGLGSAERPGNNHDAKGANAFGIATGNLIGTERALYLGGD